MNATGKAVFLSYASQDNEAARTICEALRAAGVEVWFDQSELRGGDAWDANIRQQIQACALFVPVISANTQSRPEGYFRLEWKLAVDRSHLMSDDHPFFVPVVIDDTPDASARVPSRFRERQWTRLPGGETPSAFCTRVKKLLGDHATVAGVDDPGPASTRPATTKPARSSHGLVPAIFAVITLTALAFWRPWRDADGNAGTASPIPVSRAGELAHRARTMIWQPNPARETLETAAQMIEQARALDANEADVWATGAQVDTWMVFYNYDTSDARKEKARSGAARALSLDRASYEARLAQAFMLITVVAQPAVRPEAETTLQALLREKPDEPRALELLGQVLRDGGRHAEAADVFKRARSFNAAGWAYFLAGKFDEAAAMADQALQVDPSVATLELKTMILSSGREDLDAALAVLEQLPASALLEDHAASLAVRVHRSRREPEKVLEVLRPISREWLSSGEYVGPKLYLTGVAHQMANRPAAAEADWRAALRLVEQRLAAQVNAPDLLLWKALLLARLGEREEAARCLDLEAQLVGAGSSRLHRNVWRLHAALLLGRNTAALDELETELKRRSSPFWHSSARFEPVFDALRGDPRFEKLLRDYLPKGAKPFPDQTTEDGTQRPALPPPSDRLASDAKSIAVLPFANLSPDPENAFFCDGMHEDVITALAKIRDLRVISRTSVMRYRETAARNLRDIAAELGVHSVLEGSVRRAGNRVRITAQLINAQSDEHLWAETYDGELTDIFALQSELAQKIAGSLHATLTAQERDALQRAPTRDTAAYDLYLRARTLFSNNANTPELVRQVNELLDEAVRRDPEFVLAYADTAKFNAVFFGDPRADPTPERLAKAEAALAEAARRAPAWGEVLVARGAVALFGRNDASSALPYFRTAVEQLPNNANAWTWLSICQAQAGLPLEAAESGEHALQLEPDSMEAGMAVMQASMLLRRYGQAWETYQQIKRRTPNISRVVPEHYIRLAADGDFAAFLATLDQQRPDATDSAALLAWEIDIAYWRQDFARMVELARQHPGDIIGERTLYAPAALIQAQGLYLLGDRAAAREQAAIALTRVDANLRARAGEAKALSLEASCRALLGEHDAARRLIREALAVALRQRGPTGVADLQFDQVHVIALCGSKDETLALLKEMLSGPFAFGAPNILRHDPLLTHFLGDDPRFDAVLLSAKSL